MFIVTQFWLAILFCMITLFCWGSWANTPKLSSRQLPFQLFYWNYGIGVLVLAVVAAFSLGGTGSHGRPFLADLSQARYLNLCLAFIGGVVFNLANILLVTAIEVAGMAVAFPIAIGLALVLGVIINYLAEPLGNVALLSLGVILILAAICVSANAYQSLKSSTYYPRLGIVISLLSGLLMGVFYRFVAASMSLHDVLPDSGKLTCYTAMVLFALGLFVSNFIFNGYMMKRPLVGEPVAFSAYWRQSLGSHAVGWLGGVIWAIGTLCNLIAADKAGFAISYGLGQGATMIAAAWGVFVWKEFSSAPKGISWQLSLMFVLYLAGLVSLILARIL